MKTIHLTIITLLLLIFSCTSKTPKKEQLADSSETVSVVDSVKDKAPKASLLSSEILEKQSFKVNNNKTVKLTSKGGVKITINKNTFVDGEGNTVDGDIEIEYKEALNPTDIVLGNMTTTYNGKFLESGGMVYINATANGEQLTIDDNKSTGFEVPAKARKKGMMLFEGKKENGKINWIKPKKIDETLAQDTLRQKYWWENEEHTIEALGDDELSLDEAQLIYQVRDKKSKRLKEIRGYEDGINEIFELKEIIKNDKSIKDSTITLGDYTIRFATSISFGEYISIVNNLDIEGTNKFTVDKTSSYIFKVKKLGWANIDRLFSDPRTKNVEFITKIDKPDDFDNVYISILFPKQNMYIPGYQKKDGTFSFTHGDYEEPKFPIGETAIVLATAYKNNVPHYALKKLVIAKEQIVSLQLKETTKEGLKTKLKAEI